MTRLKDHDHDAQWTSKQSVIGEAERTGQDERDQNECWLAEKDRELDMLASPSYI